MKDYDTSFRILEEPLMITGIGVAFAKEDDRGICEQMDQTLEEMRRDGTSLKIIEKYLDDPGRYLEVDELGYLGKDKEKADRNSWYFVWNLCGGSFLTLFLSCGKSGSRRKNEVEIVNYVKVQCSTYTHYNESSESKSLLRAIESARQMSTNINMERENGGQLSREFLKDNLQTLWVDGILVLDAEGKTVCEYSTKESLTDEITEYLQKKLSWILQDMKKEAIRTACQGRRVPDRHCSLRQKRRTGYCGNLLLHIS